MVELAGRATWVGAVVGMTEAGADVAIAVAVGAAERIGMRSASGPVATIVSVSVLAAADDAADRPTLGSTAIPSTRPAAKTLARPTNIALHHRACGLSKFGPRNGRIRPDHARGYLARQTGDLQPGRRPG